MVSVMVIMHTSAAHVAFLSMCIKSLIYCETAMAICFCFSETMNIVGTPLVPFENMHPALVCFLIDVLTFE